MMKLCITYFWTHLDAVKLLNAFNIVFFMDCTYKTNKYKLPLCEHFKDSETFFVGMMNWQK